MKAKDKTWNLNKTVKDKRGFTLAELLLVVGIILILAGISFVAASHYFKVLKLTEMDNTAKQIFIATQNHLTSAQASGDLDRYVLSDEVINNRGVISADELAEQQDDIALGKLMDYKPSDAGAAGISWPDPLSSNDKYYYIVHDKNSDRSKSILKYALPAGAVDDYVNTDGKYIIEYDIATASVYGVFYTEDKNILTADTVQELNTMHPEYGSTGRGGSDAAKKVRMGHMRDGHSEIIGYYGGAMAKNWEAEEADLQLQVKNGNKEVTDWENTGHQYNKEQLTAIIRDFSGKGTKKIVLKVHGESSGNDALISGDVNSNQNAMITNGSPLVYSVDFGRSDKRQTFGHIYQIDQVAGQSKASIEYQIVLDDLIQEDIPGMTNKNCHFAFLFPTMLPGENITLTAYAYDSGGSCIGASDSLVTNSLFENTDDTAGLRTGEISSFRHLENMAKDISGIQEYGNQYTYKDKYVVDGDKSLDFKQLSLTPAITSTVDFTYANYKQTADLTWDDYYNKTGSEKQLIGVNKNNLGNSCASYDLTGTVSSGKTVYPGTYYSIDKFNLLDYDGDGHKIENVKILNNIVNTTSNPTGNERNNGALFGYHDNSNALSTGKNCTIHDLTLSNFNVKAPKNVAALCAESKRVTADLHFEKVLVEKGALVSARYSEDGKTRISTGSNMGNGGALIGYCGKSIYVDKCSSSATVKVTGTGYGSDSTSSHLNATDTGGLVGEIAGFGKFSNSYTGGTTDSDGDYDLDNANIQGSYTAGGILGRASNNGTVTFSNCYSTCSVYSELEYTIIHNLLYPAYSGGLVGYSETKKISFSKCYSAAPVLGLYNVGWIGTKRGTIIGGGTAVYSGCYYMYFSQKDGAETINGDIYANGEDSRDPSGVTMKTYNGMKSSGNQTHPNERSGDYPFKTVNSTGKTGSAGVNGVHYGDWPKKQDAPIVANDLMFAYREIINGETYWYIVKKDNNGNCSLVDSNLPEGSESYMTDSDSWDYGFVCDNSFHTFQSYFSNEHKDFTDKGEIDLLAGQGKTYTYYEYTGGETGIVWTPRQKYNKGNSNSRFVFNTLFGGCISAGGTYETGAATLGDDSNMYQIRNLAQLNNIKVTTVSEDRSFLDNSFKQSLDIDLNGVADFVSIGNKSNTASNGFSGEYDGEGHEIKNFSQTINTGEDMGLFGMISSSGDVRDLTLTGKSAANAGAGIDIDIRALKVVTAYGDSSSGASVDIGGFAAYNAGSVSDCEAELNMSSENAGSTLSLSNSMISIGGMFGSCANSSGNEVRGCSFTGKLLLNNLSCASGNSSTRLRAGAFVGRSAMSMSDCVLGEPDGDPAAMNIKINNSATIGNNRNERIGGFVGEKQTASATNCSANVDLTYDVGTTGRLALIGGFVGYREGSIDMSSCTAKGSLKVNCAEGYKTSSLRTSSVIGIFGGNLFYDGNSTVECYYNDDTTPIVFDASGIYTIN